MDDTHPVATELSDIRRGQSRTMSQPVAGPDQPDTFSHRECALAFSTCSRNRMEMRVQGRSCLLCDRIQCPVEVTVVVDHWRSRTGSPAETVTRGARKYLRRPP
jgi:hypothetical protein